MALTPQDVRNKAFSATRLREGYDMGEVDAFLDEVEEELARLLAENESLRSGASAERTPSEPSPVLVTAPAVEDAADDADDVVKDAPEPAAAVVEAEPALAQPERLTVTTTAEASVAAARLLENASRIAAELETSTASEVERLLAEAKEQAEALRTQAATEAEEVQAEARNRAQTLDAETEKRRESAFGDIEKEREKLNADVETLRVFEREYRSRLKSYFTQQLDTLESWNPEDSAKTPGAVKQD